MPKPFLYIKTPATSTQAIVENVSPALRNEIEALVSKHQRMVEDWTYDGLTVSTKWGFTKFHTADSPRLLNLVQLKSLRDHLTERIEAAEASS